MLFLLYPNLELVDHTLSNRHYQLQTPRPLQGGPGTKTSLIMRPETPTDQAQSVGVSLGGRQSCAHRAEAGKEPVSLTGLQAATCPGPVPMLDSGTADHDDSTA